MIRQTVRLITGQEMPLIGLGTSRAGNELRNALKVALEHGYRSIDTAYFYLNEKCIGEELHEWFSQGKLKREEMFITTKLPPSGNRQQDVEKFLKLSLENLKLDYVDLYLIHSPVGIIKGKDKLDILPKFPSGEIMLDGETDLESIWKGMEEQVDLGLTKAIGVSNFNSAQLDRILNIARIKPAVNQIEAHVYLQQRPLHDKCRKHGIVVCAYAPIGAPYRDLNDEFVPKLNEHPTVMDIANHHGKSPSQVLLKFLLQIGCVIIPKSITPARIRENLDIFDFTLDDEEMNRLRNLDRGEENRIFDFKEFLGITKHKEYPH